MGLSGPGSKVATGTGVKSLSSVVFLMADKAGHWHAPEEDKCIWGAGETP